MRSLLFMFLILLGFVLQAQPTLEKVRPLIAAEQAFIRMAKEQNTRDAFLHFFADDAITAPRGRGPSKGKKHLEEQTANESWLHWWPVFSDIAASGDLGYNTGPWEFRSNRTDTQPIAYGQFVSVWTKDANGNWRVALDMGISHDKPSKVYKLATSTTNDEPSAGGNHLFDVERKLVSALNGSDPDVLSHFLSSEAKVLRPGAEPATTTSEIVGQFVNSSNLFYTFVDGDVASSGELGYAYGSVKRSDGTESNAQYTHSYVRIWKKQKDGWKIVVDLISD